jgi:hypothetical protein
VIKPISLSLFALVLFSGSTVMGALVVGESQWNAGNVLPLPIIAVSGDLLETSVASATGENASANVRNGTTGTAQNNATPDPAKVWGQDTTTYEFDLAASPQGYDIDEIRLFSGWGDGRAAQSYRIHVSTVGDASYQQLGTDIAVNGSGGSLLTRTYDNGGVPIATGVDAIQFEFYNGPQTYDGNQTVYREFDVLGTATVPEPSTACLAALGLLGLIGFGRRRKR